MMNSTLELEHVSAHALWPMARCTLMLALLFAGSALAQDFSVDWHTVDGGGEILSETADTTWQLSGTIGQPDATELIDLAGSDWTLTGGFWGVNIDQTDILFRDEFEGGASAPL